MGRRLSSAGRATIVGATYAAARQGTEHTEPEHFLLAVLEGPPSAAQSYLVDHGLGRATVEQALRDVADADDLGFDDDDRAALAELGLDLPDLLRRLEERFGPDAAAPAPRRRRPGPRRLAAGMSHASAHLVKAALMEAAIADTAMGPEHVLLAIMRDPTPLCADLLAAYELDYDDARTFLFPPPQRDAG